MNIDKLRILHIIENTFHRDFEFDLGEHTLSIYVDDWTILVGNDFVSLSFEGRSISYAKVESFADAYALTEYYVRVTEITGHALDSTP